jgi:hypothetical protein
MFVVPLHLLENLNQASVTILIKVTAAALEHSHLLLT